MKARIIRQPRMQMGSKSNSEGGGGKGGSTSGSTSNDAVSPISRYNHSRLKLPEPAANNLLLDDDVLSYSTAVFCGRCLLVFLLSTPLLFSSSSSTPDTPRLIKSNINSKHHKRRKESPIRRPSKGYNRSNLYSKYQLSANSDKRRKETANRKECKEGGVGGGDG
ncbi:hypothetical protein MLD38_027412 [Melastoma candidum]|uniref:Uncharacterized protein n=1 Tax=Melastoma candidum TaxID=119954 RepID=A0ACB9P4N8_9MYRT|nr:hypothetical protein MLD38_027412 [Melastoma candidum]